MFNLLVPGTIPTYSIKISGVSLNNAIKILSSCFVDIINVLHLEIDDTSTFLTHKMIMWGSISIKMIRSVTNP